MSTALAQLTDVDFSREKIELIKRTIAVGASDDELQLFLYTCKRTGLDPLARQIYSIKRGGKMTIQTGIDGYRVIADRTGKLAGISDYTFDSEEKAFPAKASVTVLKRVDGFNAEFTATARWGEYNAGGPMWAKMPYLMLGKCAEALALRKAFPADLSGVYTAEEMAQADNDQQRDAVCAEVEKQKAEHKPVSYPTLDASEGIPPELEWGYNKSSGVLICRILDAKQMQKKDTKADFVCLQINGKVEGSKKDKVYYWHATHRDLLLNSIGKIAKLVVTEKADFPNVTEVLEVDGVKQEKPVDANVELQARTAGSILGLTDKELLTVLKMAGGDWQVTLDRINEQIAKQKEEAPA